MAPSQIEVVIHPQSIVHSLVEFIDGALVAQISSPDMILPIQYALTYPNRRPGLMKPFDFERAQEWTFFPPDKNKFLCLRLSQEALIAGKSYPCFLNAVNEILVERFVRKEIPWTAIGEKLEQLISSHHPEVMLSLEAILDVDLCARQLALKS
jgi:1-deoxy-D-xylulose-5-phosphate reductoisomerase